MRFNTIFTDIKLAAFDTTVDQVDAFLEAFGGWIDDSYEEGAITATERQILLTALLDAEKTIV